MEFNRFTSVIEEVFTQNNWHYEEVRNAVYRTERRCNNGTYKVFVCANDPDEVVQVRVIAADVLPERYRQLAMEYLTRANYGLRIGNFEMNCANGTVYFRVSACFEDNPFLPSAFLEMLVRGLFTMDEYYPGLMETVWGGKPPQKAIRDIECPTYETEISPSEEP